MEVGLTGRGGSETDNPLPTSLVDFDRTSDVWGGGSATARQSHNASRDTISRELQLSAEHFLRNEQANSRRHWFPRGRNLPQAVHMLASGDGESVASLVVTLVSLCLTVAAVVLSCYDVEMEDPTMVKVESGCVIFFSVEYVVRLLTARHRAPPSASVGVNILRDGHNGKESFSPTIKGFVLAPPNLIDLVTVAPYWVGMLLHHLSPVDGRVDDAASNSVVLRALRIIRMARVVRLVRYARALTVVMGGLKRSRENLVVLFGFLGISTLLMGTIVFHVRRRTTAEEDQVVDSVPATFVFVLGQIADLSAIKSKDIQLDTTLAGRGAGRNGNRDGSRHDLRQHQTIARRSTGDAAKPCEADTLAAASCRTPQRGYKASKLAAARRKAESLLSLRSECGQRHAPAGPGKSGKRGRHCVPWQRGI